MTQFVRYLIGVAWVVSGALMASNPPPHQAPRAGQFPAIGAVILLGGIGYLLLAERNAVASAWPYQRGRVARRLSAAIGVLALAAGGWVLWSGAASGQLSVVGLGCALAALSVLGLVNSSLRPGPTRALPQHLSPPLGQ